MTTLCSCIVCKCVKSVKGIHTHYLVSHTPEGKTRIKKSSKSGYDKGLQTFLKNIQHKKEKYISNPSKCKHCLGNLSYEQRNNKFCSNNCSASYNNINRRLTDKQKLKISNSLRNRPDDKKLPKYTPVSRCDICKKWFPGKRKTCGKDCLHVASIRTGKISASKQKKRSIDEIKLFNLCASNFVNVTHNEPIFNGWDADILIHDTKTAILWNGPWHYKNMPGLKHSLKQVQNRDKIKIKEIETAGWTAVVFEDRFFSPETAFSELVGLLGLEPRTERF